MPVYCMSQFSPGGTAFRSAMQPYSYTVSVDGNVPPKSPNKAPIKHLFMFQMCGEHKEMFRDFSVC